VIVWQDQLAAALAYTRTRPIAGDHDRPVLALPPRTTDTTDTHP